MDPASSRTGTGFIIKLGGCPLLWKSHLQSLTALSTAESEYVALSQSMRVIFPLQILLENIFLF
jgi:hypothetical protein